MIPINLTSEIDSGDITILDLMSKNALQAEDVRGVSPTGPFSINNWPRRTQSDTDPVCTGSSSPQTHPLGVAITYAKEPAEMVRF